MSKKPKNILTIGLFVIGAYLIASGFTAIAFNNQVPTTGTMMFVGMIIVLIASVLAISTFLDKTAKPIAVLIHQGIWDDLENLKNGRITWPIWQVMLTGFFGIIFNLLVLRFHKFEAVWFGWLPVWLVAGLLCMFMVAIVTRTSWFNDYRFDTPGWVFWIAAGCFIVGMWVGIQKTEDVRLINLSYSPQQSSYNYYHFSYNNYYILGDEDSSSFTSFEMPECSGDSCEGLAYLYCLVGFVLFCLLLIVGCGIFQHFWLVAGSLFITSMMLIAWQRLMVREDTKFGRRRAYE